MPFAELRNLVVLKKMRDCMNDAFAFSIETGKEKLAIDFVKYSRQQRFSLVINDTEMKLLIQQKFYNLIEDLVNANSMLRIDYRKLEQHEKIGQIFGGSLLPRS